MLPTKHPRKPLHITLQNSGRQIREQHIALMHQAPCKSVGNKLKVYLRDNLFCTVRHQLIFLQGQSGSGADEHFGGLRWRGEEGRGAEVNIWQEGGTRECCIHLCGQDSSGLLVMDSKHCSVRTFPFSLDQREAIETYNFFHSLEVTW